MVQYGIPPLHGWPDACRLYLLAAATGPRAPSPPSTPPDASKLQILPASSLDPDGRDVAAVNLPANSPPFGTFPEGRRQFGVRPLTVDAAVGMLRLHATIHHRHPSQPVSQTPKPIPRNATISHVAIDTASSDLKCLHPRIPFHMST